MFEFIKRPIKDSLKSNMSVGRKLGLSERNSELLSIGIVSYLLFVPIFLLPFVIHMTYIGNFTIYGGFVISIVIIFCPTILLNMNKKFCNLLIILVCVVVLISGVSNEFLGLNLPFENGTGLPSFFNELIIILVAIEFLIIIYPYYKSEKGKK